MLYDGLIPTRVNITCTAIATAETGLISILKAQRGIRFIDPNYKEKFKLRDGGRISLKGKDGSEYQETCRYIDDYHLEVGRNLYHICEFAERTEQCGYTVEPLEGLIPAPERKVQNRGDER